MFKSVKVYRVTHKIPEVAWLNNGLRRMIPTPYRPYYLGNYDANGNLTEDDAYLYWLLPIMCANDKDPKSKIRDFACLHAGDPNGFGRSCSGPNSTKTLPPGGCRTPSTRNWCSSRSGGLARRR